jgi:hypothetical protein
VAYQPKVSNSSPFEALFVAPEGALSDATRKTTRAATLAVWADGWIGERSYPAMRSGGAWTSPSAASAGMVIVRVAAWRPSR